MHLRTAFSTLIVVGLAVGAVSGRAAPRSTEIPVTTMIADIAAGWPLRIQSDRQGPYLTSTAKRTGQIKSVLLSNPAGHDWSLTTYYSSKGGFADSNRTVFFDLREQVSAGSFPTPPLGTDTYGAPVEFGWVTAHLIVKCSQVTVDMIEMPNGAVALCPGSFRFRSPDDQWYRFSFQPENYADVDRFKVTCVAADSTGCTVWTISPSGTVMTAGDPNPKSLNKLLLISDQGEILAEGGNYYLSFSITVAR
jgi:hypothetical protein